MTTIMDMYFLRLRIWLSIQSLKHLFLTTEKYIVGYILPIKVFYHFIMSCVNFILELAKCFPVTDSTDSRSCTHRLFARCFAETNSSDTSPHPDTFLCDLLEYVYSYVLHLQYVNLLQCCI